jgi:hypothetical protein
MGELPSACGAQVVRTWQARMAGDGVVERVLGGMKRMMNMMYIVCI